MLKLATFNAVSERGDLLVRPFRQGEGITKLAGDMMPAVQDWLRGYKSDKKYIAILVNALGASEVWGQNSNGDIFTWPALSHDCSVPCTVNTHPFDTFVQRKIGPYGYQTFYLANPYIHHQNKDPSRAFGKVVLSVLNHRMRRIEIVALLERELAYRFGAGFVIDALDRGDFPDVSMGCKVPYDRCAICENKAIEPKHYCNCIKQLGMGRILPDGRRVGVFNDYPRFFDISFVWIGADKTAKMMSKLAGYSATDFLPVEFYGDPFPKLPQSVTDAARLYTWKDVEPRVAKMASMVTVPDNLVDISSSNVISPAVEVHLNSLEDASRVGAGRDGIVRTTDGTMYGTRRDPEDGAAFREGRSAAEVLAMKMQTLSAGAQRLLKLHQRRNPDLVKVARDVVAGTHRAEGTALFDQLDELIAPTEKTARLAQPPHRNRYPYHGRRKFRGLDILVENAAGTWRTGKGWATKMKYDYGEIAGSMGADGDAVDVFVGPNEKAPNVYVVHQVHVVGPKKGDYDEDKAMLGFTSSDDAKRAYLAHYDSPEHFGSITEMPFNRFEKLVTDGKVKEKLAELATIKLATVEDLFMVGMTREKVASAPAVDDGPPPTTEQLRKARIVRDYFEEHRANGVPVEEAKKLAFAEAKKDERWMVKTAGNKLAEIVKEIRPEGSVGRIAAAFSAHEQALPSSVLDELSRHSMESALATPSLMGIPLKPEEFQTLVLRTLGKSELADELAQRGVVFEPSGESSPLCAPLTPEHFNEDIMHALLGSMDQRSYLSPVLVRRIWALKMAPPESKTSVAMGGPFLSKLGAAYNHYRKEMAKVAAQGAPSTLQRHPMLMQKVARVSEEDLFIKTAEIDAAVAVPLAVVPLALMLAAGIRSKIEAGEDVGTLQRLVAEHPYLTALGAAALTRSLAREKAVREMVARSVA